ncbi:MAG: hypothetical protein ACREU2_03500, partial [Steroidobacteraceae bacterium]
MSDANQGFWCRAATLACAAAVLGAVGALPGAVRMASAAGAAPSDWPSYNRTLTSDRFSPLAEINTGNAARLKLLCTYDTGRQ